MALDPEAALLLTELGRMSSSFETTSVAELREQRASRAAPGPDAVPLGSVEDLAMTGRAGPLRLRHYRPAAASGTPLPAVVFFHGGGWVMGGLDSHDAICRRLTAAVECAFVAVDYRLAPEHPWPAAVEDAEDALAWVATRTGELGIDGTRLAVAGDSAGANLAAVVAQRASRTRHAPTIAFQLLIYPLTDARGGTRSWHANADGPFVTAASMRWFWEQYLGEADGTSPDASPLLADDLSGLPPAMVVTAEHDVLRSEGEAYGQRLAEAGVPVTLRCYAGMFHGFLGFVDRLAVARRATDDIVAATRAALATREHPAPPTPHHPSNERGTPVP